MNTLQFYLQNPLIGAGVILRVITLFILLKNVLPVQYNECRIQKKGTKVTNLCYLLTALIVSYVVTTILPIILSACMPFPVCRTSNIIDFLSLVNAINTLIAGIIFYFIYSYKY